ncbi:hypothetical protein D1B31_19385 [Neobacillus notoginsengisoli]|uniref:Uncharacterized protein n=1 Tax=Neobacillus notoginsengisoli TaxID=1578198 RepID=A0A417YN41_9BACI|nr:hypothetical protein [Neobacillus notoginsengisoli]RHW34830.1 hypothetical protein D1B31_19385 [Neobacillus notoginsengisoli]
MKGFFSSKIGYQTIATLVTLLSFPFLYVGGTQHSSGVLNIGFLLMLSGMLATPVIGFVYGKKSAKTEIAKEVAKEVSKVASPKLRGNEV